MNTKNWIKIFGEKAIVDMFKEYKQLYDGRMSVKPVVAPFNTDGLIPLYRKKVSKAVILIKEKRCGKIKGRTCANCSKQRNYLKPYENVYSPACSTKELMAALVIVVMYRRDVGIFSVPGDFLQTTLPADIF